MPGKGALKVLAGVLGTLTGWLLLLPFLGAVPKLSLPVLYGVVLSNPIVLLLLWAGHAHPEGRYDYPYWAGKAAVLSVYAVFVLRLFFPRHTALFSLRARGLFMNPVLHGLIAIAFALDPGWAQRLFPPAFWKPFGAPPRADLGPEDFLLSGLAYAALGALHLWASAEGAKGGRAERASEADRGDGRAPNPFLEEPLPAAGGEGFVREAVPGKPPTPPPPPGPIPQAADRRRRLEVLRRALEGAELEEGLDLERVAELSAHLSETALDERVRLARFKAEAMGKPLTWDLLRRALEKK